jgi:hypothetical protein
VKNREVLREQWMWNREARSIWLWVFIASGAILAAILYQFQGAMGLAAGFLPFLLTCAIVGPMCSYVGRKVGVLSESLAGEEGDVAEALAHIGSIQGPAIVIMKETELVLVPLAGKRLSVPLDDIESVREAGNMYGKGFLWKRAFLVKAPQNKRIGLAVAPSVAGRWRDRLNPAGRCHV